MKKLVLLVFIISTLASSISCKQEHTSDKTSQATTQPDFPKKNLNPLERYGILLKDVQMQRVFADGKTFVDCVPKYPADTILKKYKLQKGDKDFNLKAFINTHFQTPETHSSNFKSDTSKTVTQHIQALWDALKRNPDEKNVGSKIALPNPYIVPGGRFREVYYWDSYFILLGLKEAKEYTLIENILDNFAYQIDTLGFIPNGNRTYYNARSQPPFFAAMVNILAKIKDKKEVYRKYENALEKEYNFWMKGSEQLTSLGSKDRVIMMPDESILNRYYSNSRKPRAESYREDIYTAQEASNRSEEQVYLDITAACESGWDFSSRWLEDPNDLSSIKTTRIVPIDLNVLIYNLEQTLATAKKLSGNTNAAEQYTKAASKRKQAINTYLWDSNAGVYKDYDLDTKTFSSQISLATVFPLYFKLSTQRQAEATAQILQSKFLKNGGLLTTLTRNGQQWDAPNGWPPHQYMAVRGLEHYKINTLAASIKKRWLTLNEHVYKRTGKMLEKYNVVDTSLVAGGGEYPTQDGFGWTNGVYLNLKNN